MMGISCSYLIRLKNADGNQGCFLVALKISGQLLMLIHGCYEIHNDDA